MRASKKLKSDELLLAGFAGTRLRMELDRVPLWRGDHVAIKQCCSSIEDIQRHTRANTGNQCTVMNPSGT